MEKFSIERELKNGNTVSLYLSTYGTHYVITAFSSDYRVLKSRKTTDYNHALNILTIYCNMFEK